MESKDDNTNQKMIARDALKRYRVTMIALLVVAICGVIFGVVGVIFYVNSSATIESLRRQIEELGTGSAVTDDFDMVYGYWNDVNESQTIVYNKYKFSEKKFYWWEYGTGAEYRGEMEAFQGDVALAVLDSTYDDFLKMMSLDDGIRKEDIYALRLCVTDYTPGDLVSDDALTKEPEFEDGCIRMSFVMIGNNEARAHNYGIDATSNLRRDTEAELPE